MIVKRKGAEERRTLILRGSSSQSARSCTCVADYARHRVSGRPEFPGDRSLACARQFEAHILQIQLFVGNPASGSRSLSQYSGEPVRDSLDCITVSAP